jgi:hypothetical protein
MSRNTSFIRKCIYAALIVALLIPLFRLGQPASYDKEGRAVGGGVLANLRSQYDLSQASLGEIDPASESMKLATLGMRGIAACVLWSQSVEYMKREDWDMLSATLNQITKLQPNFRVVWEHQGWNLAYNVSVQFDDFRHRYHWVKKGLDFLIEGTQYNKKEAKLIHYVGWVFGHKLGRADEYRQFRELFRNDRDYHGSLGQHILLDRDARSRYDQLPDNWLVGRQWFLKAQSLVDTGDRPLRGKSPLVFHADPSKALMNYADAIEEEGRFGEVAKAAWSDALADWLKYGDRQIPSSWGVNIRLNEFDKILQDVGRLEKELEALVPEGRSEIEKERLAALSAEEREVWETPDDKKIELLSERQWEIYHQIRGSMEILDADLAARATTENRDKAERVARKLASSRQMLDYIDRYRNQVNFVYWRTRCEAEQTDEATGAREHIYQAIREYEETRLEQAKKHFDQGWDLWAQVFERFPSLKDDLSSHDMRRYMDVYRATLSHLGEELPRDFKLQWLVDLMNEPQVPAQDFVPLGGEPAGEGGTLQPN